VFPLLVGGTNTFQFVKSDFGRNLSKIGCFSLDYTFMGNGNFANFDKKKSHNEVPLVK